MSHLKPVLNNNSEYYRLIAKKKLFTHKENISKY